MTFDETACLQRIHQGWQKMYYLHPSSAVVKKKYLERLGYSVQLSFCEFHKRHELDYKKETKS